MKLLDDTFCISIVQTFNLHVLLWVVRKVMHFTQMQKRKSPAIFTFTVNGIIKPIFKSQPFEPQLTAKKKKEASQHQPQMRAAAL